MRVSLSPARIALLYVLVSGAWIVTSDRVLASLFSSREFLHVQTYKGLGFVVLTALLLYLLLHLREKELARADAQRHDALAARTDSERRYRMLLEEASEGIVVTDGEFRLLEVNAPASQVFGRLADHLVGRPMAEFLVAGSLDREPFRPDSLRTGRPVLAERKLIRPDSREVVVELSARQLGDGRILTIIRDLTERRRLEEQVRQSQKMEALGHLTGGIAHDLNNVLTVVLANASLVRHAIPPGDAETEQELVELEASANRGAAMVRKLLSFSRTSPITLASIDLGRLVAELEPTLRRLIPSNIAIACAADANVFVRADASALEQIVLNLATNARDAMPAGGRLTIEVRTADLPDDAPLERAAGSFGVLTVSDTGLGMDSSTRIRVFEPFFTTKAVGEGTGLGMTVAYGLVRQHRGTIVVESGKGQGTSVQVAIPAAPPAVEVPRPTAPVGSTWPRGTETVLLAEDEAPLRRTATRILERLGYTVLAAADGLEALEVYERHRGGIDLVLSDVMMPRMGGRQLFEAVRDLGGSERFLFSSGYGAEELRGLGVDETERPVLRKPWAADELAQSVRDALDAQPR